MGSGLYSVILISCLLSMQVVFVPSFRLDYSVRSLTSEVEFRFTPNFSTWSAFIFTRKTYGSWYILNSLFSLDGKALVGFNQPRGTTNIFKRLFIPHPNFSNYFVTAAQIILSSADRGNWYGSRFWNKWRILTSKTLLSILSWGLSIFYVYFVDYVT